MGWSYWIAIGVGLTVGGIVGFFAVRNIGVTWKALMARSAVIAFFAAGSALCAPFIAEGLLGGIFPEPPIEEEISTRLREQPVLARLFRDFPDVEREFRRRGAAAYRSSGEQAMMDELERATQEAFAWARYHYMPRAQDADLLRYTNELVRVLKDLGAKDPILCALWTSPPAGGEFIISSDIRKAIGDVSMLPFEQAADEAISRANIAVPDYDASRAEAIITAVGTDLIIRSGYTTLAMLSGRTPIRTADDSRKVCIAAAQMYERITQYRREDAVGALRDVFLAMARKQKPKPSSS